MGKTVVVNDPVERIDGSNYLKLVKDNHELQKSVETLEQ